MTTENLEYLRARLLSEERVLEMIRVRAYEIFQMRGPQHGGAAKDWLDAEGEVLTFLIAQESRLTDQNDAAKAVTAVDNPSPIAESAVKKTRRISPKATGKQTTKKPAAKRTAAKKPAASKSKPKASRKKSGTEKSDQ